jgi:hypothetical protein
MSTRPKSQKIGPDPNASRSEAEAEQQTGDCSSHMEARSLARAAPTRKGFAVFSLSDAELDTIMNLAQPLDPLMRDPFLRAVAIELARYEPEAIGVGLINRIGRQLQREFLKAVPLSPERKRVW